MNAQFLYGQETVMVDYTPTSADVLAGTVVVIGVRPLICHVLIKQNKLGALAFSGGTYIVTKASGTAIAAGVKLYWDDTAKVATATATSNTVLGYASTAGAASADLSVIVHHSPA